MEPEFPLQDLIMYRIHKKRSLLELEAFGSFKKELRQLLCSGMITCMQDREDPSDYPYEFDLTPKGLRKLFR